MSVTLCPVALAVGCKKCPVFKICPVKSLIGDAPAAKDDKSAPAAKPASGPKKSSK